MLCLLSNVKLLLGLTVSTQDALLNRLISSISGRIENYCNRTFAYTNYDEYYFPNNRQDLYLRNFPIQVTKIVTGAPVTVAVVVIDNGATLVDGGALPTPGTNWDYQHDAFDNACGRLWREDFWRGSYKEGGLTLDPVGVVKEIEVQYASGWYHPDNALYVEGDITALPQDLQNVCEMWVMKEYFIIKRQDIGVQSHSEGGIDYRYDKQLHPEADSIGIPAEFVESLKKYRRPIIV